MPGKRTALWQQRQRAADLLQVASRYPSFPMLLEATREALQDVFDLPALEQLLRDLRSRRVRLVPVETASASPFAQSLLFGWVGQYMYEYDAPLAERRAQALALDRDLLRELLGGDELRDLLDATSSRRSSASCSGWSRCRARAATTRPTVSTAGPRRRRAARRAARARSTHGDELAERSRQDPGDWVERCWSSDGPSRCGSRARTASLPPRTPPGCGTRSGWPCRRGYPPRSPIPVEDPLADLVARYARTHGPFDEHAVRTPTGVPLPRVLATLRWLARQDRVVEGEFRPDGSGREWVDSEVLRRLKRRSLAALRAEVEPVDAAALGRFLPAWQHVRAATGSRRRGLEALLETVAQLQGTPIPASVLETDVLPARLEGYRGADLDQLIAAGEVVWLGSRAARPQRRTHRAVLPRPAGPAGAAARRRPPGR
jgi:ATP-dependent helicase Lhr and Lhr-like helicase